MPTKQLGFIHRFIPASEVDESKTLLLLHGTSGDETSLISLGRELVPGAAMLSPRGKVLENGKSRFFRRFADGRWDIADLAVRTRELADFVEAASVFYGYDLREVIVVGYSNGANIAANLLLHRPSLLVNLVLFRALLRTMPVALPNLVGVAVFIAAGRLDPMFPQEYTQRLVEVLKQAGADVTLHLEEVGHDISHEEVEVARDWLSTRLPTKL